MHKEVVGRKRTHSIIIVLLFLICMLYLNKFLLILDIDSLLFNKVCRILMVSIFTLVILLEIVNCKKFYKYSIIGSKLIINRILGQEEKNLLSININDIVYVGSKKNMPKNLKIKSNKNYSCEIIHNNLGCCIYSTSNGDFKKFDFKPSIKLINRLVNRS